MVDPLTLWYVDVFFIKRERYLILTNPITKFTFYIFRYTKKSHPDFMEAFRDTLAETLQTVGIKSPQYLDQCDILVPYTIADKSASAHMSRIKTDYKGLISTNDFRLDPNDEERHFNRIISDYITTFHKKDYDYPKRRFHHEWLKQKLHF